MGLVVSVGGTEKRNWKEVIEGFWGDNVPYVDFGTVVKSLCLLYEIYLPAYFYGLCICRCVIP